jgi:8-oxo-dGTP pyrophosphatase MutT (NUDIX family)
MSDPDPIRQVKKAIEAILAESGAFPRPVARGVVVDACCRIIRGQPHRETRWEYPGGGVDEGESSVAAAIRETQEEARVIAKAVPGLQPFQVIEGRVSRHCLAFGAPRRYRPGREISQAAYDLLWAAARRLDPPLDEANYRRHRYAWFDALMDLQVPWQGKITYHVLALTKRLPFQPCRWGWQSRRWFDLATLQRRASPGGHTTRLLAWGLAEFVPLAALVASDGEGYGD